ncbi:MAG: FAD-dependent oxidoreductase [Candidatus Bipolaricaulota bacterium]|nr:FAD-dependent oxidoreductase [Candidatus Bipolaricaulota bacterium]MDW8127280.1 FAD-dependent oxidoreductase [Candidatus Bipolaricaulota bacterium]
MSAILGKEEVYEVIVIGGGPAGATAALYAARAGLRTLVLDKGVYEGAAGRAQRIENFPGVPGPISGAELVRRIQEQAQSFGAEFRKEKVLQAEVLRDPKEVWTASGTYQAKALIVATGAMGRNQFLPGEERLIGRGVSYCAACDAPFFRGAVVAVAGNTGEAVEEALSLAKFAARVLFLVPSTNALVPPELWEELKGHPNVEVRISTRILEIVGKEKVEAIRVATKGSEEIIPVAGVFPLLQGTAPVVDFLGGQVRLGEGGCVQVDEGMRTSVPGVFAAGDVCCKRFRQAVIAAAEGCVAAVSAEVYVRGRSSPRADWGR